MNLEIIKGFQTFFSCFLHPRIPKLRTSGYLEHKIINHYSLSPKNINFIQSHAGIKLEYTVYENNEKHVGR